MTEQVDNTPTELKRLIEEYIKYEEDFKAFNESIKPQLDKLKEMKEKLKSYKSEIEMKMINGKIEEFVSGDYKFGVVERKVKPKPTQEEFNDVVLDELKKNMKKDKAEEIMNNALKELNNIDEQKVKKMNIKKQSRKKKVVKKR